MAGPWYVRSTDGDNASDGLSWANAKATLAGAFTAASAGDIIYVSQAHAETQASAMTLTSPGTAAAPCKVLCVNDSAEPPTDLATTATISTTGANSLTLSNGYSYVYGIEFVAGSTTANLLMNAIASNGWFLEACRLSLGGVTTGNRIVLGHSLGSGASYTKYIYLKNTTFSFAHAAQSISLQQGNIIWCDTPSAISATVPTTLFLTGAYQAILKITGVDLSALGSGKNIVNVTGTSPALLNISNCKLGASVAVITGASTNGGKK